MPTELYIYSLIQITISADSESYLVFPVREKIRIDRSLSLCPLHTISYHLQAGSSSCILFRDREREPNNKYERRSLQSSPTELPYAIIKWELREFQDWQRGSRKKTEKRYLNAHRVLYLILCVSLSLSLWLSFHWEIDELHLILHDEKRNSNNNRGSVNFLMSNSTEQR